MGRALPGARRFIRIVAARLLAQKGIPTTIEQQLAVLKEVQGGLDAIGTVKLENMYHGAWARAGATPLPSTKLVAAHVGGTRSLERARDDGGIGRRGPGCR